MRRLAAMFCASLVLAGLLLVPLAAGVSAATTSYAGFACDPHGTTGGSPTTTLSSAKVDTTGGTSQLTCLFRGTRLPLSTGGTCAFDNGAFLVEFSRRTLLPVNNNTNLICSGATSVTPETDLKITKTDGTTTAVVGTTTTYTIVVTNAGPNAATGATVSDAFPAASFTSDTYTSVAAGGATGNTASGSGDIADTLTLPVGASVTYTVVATISASATGHLANTASVTAPAGIIDSVPGNNSATDNDTFPADLSFTISDGITQVVAGNTTPLYSFTVTNNGPNPVAGVTGSGSGLVTPAGTGLVASVLPHRRARTGCKPHFFVPHIDATRERDRQPRHDGHRDRGRPTRPQPR